MLRRVRELMTLRDLLNRHPIVGLVGARQVGKTTLARAFLRGKKRSTYLDLENPEDEARLGDPMLALKDLRGTKKIFPETT